MRTVLRSTSPWIGHIASDVALLGAVNAGLGGLAGS